jgi:hypothetical protein
MMQVTVPDMIAWTQRIKAICAEQGLRNVFTTWTPTHLVARIEHPTQPGHRWSLNLPIALLSAADIKTVRCWAANAAGLIAEAA